MPFYRGQPPINKKKDAEAIAPIFGTEVISPMSNTPQFTPEEIEKMRAVVLDADRKNTGNSFDLSKPPKVPYVYQQFPQMIYHHESSVPSHEIAKRVHGEDQIVHVEAKLVTKTVNSQKELEFWLAKGWQEKPPVLKHRALTDQAEAQAEETEDGDETGLDAAPEQTSDPAATKKRGRKPTNKDAQAQE